MRHQLSRGAGAGAGPEASTPFPVKTICFAWLGPARSGPRCDNKRPGAKITEPNPRRGPLGSDPLEGRVLWATVVGMQSTAADLQMFIGSEQPFTFKGFAL